MENYLKVSVLEYCFRSRRQRMHFDPDAMNGGKPIVVCALWTISRDIHEVEFFKVVVKQWTLQDMCNSSFINVFEHVTTTCAETLFLRCWVNCWLVWFEPTWHYLFFLGARSFSAITATHNSTTYTRLIFGLEETLLRITLKGPASLCTNIFLINSSILYKTIFILCLYCETYDLTIKNSNGNSTLRAVYLAKNFHFFFFLQKII